MAISKIIVNGETHMDVTQDTVAANNLLVGKMATGADGNKVNGAVDVYDGTVNDTADVFTYDDPKDVDIIDYDGTLLYTYTASDFLALTELPPNPRHPGLVAQGWNWTLADAKEFVSEYGCLVIGQNYTTDNGHTKLYMDVTNADFTINIWLSLVDATVKIDWGDGSYAATLTGTGSKSGSKKYAAAGRYCIQIWAESGSVYLGYYGANHGLLLYNGEAEDSRFYTAGYLRKVEMGDSVAGFRAQAFRSCVNLETISVSATCTNFGAKNNNYLFDSNLLKCVVVPHGSTGRDSYIFSSRCVSLKYFSLPKSTEMFGVDPSIIARSLVKYIVPWTSVSSIGGTDSYLYLTHFVCGESVTTFNNYALEYCQIKSLYLPSSVTSIGRYAFGNARNLSEVHIRATTPPSLSISGSFSKYPSVIYVPYSEDHSILEAYQNATNWSALADKLQEEPQS